MLRKFIAATLAGTVLMSSIGAAWSQDPRFIFRYRAGLVLPVGADIGTPDNGGDDGNPDDGGEPGQTQYIDIELNNGWQRLAPLLPSLGNHHGRLASAPGRHFDRAQDRP